MKDFLKKVIEGSNISPSNICLKAFIQNFEDAINVEWYNIESYFEAVFYKDKLEHIAIFDLYGGLMEYKTNLPKEYLPEPLKKTVESRGEIMNIVMRNKGNFLEYEVIVRDKELNRYLLTLSNIGKLMEEKML